MAQTEVYLVNKNDVNSDKGQAVLVDGEAHHLLRVRRAIPGQEIILINGMGDAWRADFISATKETALCHLKQHLPGWCEPPVYVHLGLAVLKSDHFNDAINLSVQAGLSEVTPLICKHCVSKFSDKKIERAKRISLKASKQCGRARVAPVNGLQPLENWCIKMQNETFRYYLDENGISQPTAKAGDSIVLAVGPEGGFHPEEITLMEKYGFKAMSLGKRRLRSETAAALSVAMTVIPTEA